MVKTILLILTLFCLNLKPIDTQYNIDEITSNEVFIDNTYNIFYDIISNQEEDNVIIPLDTEILGISWNGEKLILDMSEEIISYGGGNKSEYEITRLLIDTAFSIDEIKEFKVLVEGKEDGFPEGTIVNISK